MKLDINQKINFKSNFNPDHEKSGWYMRLLRPRHFCDMIGYGKTYSIEIPFWSELAGYRTKRQRFKDKF